MVFPNRHTGEQILEIHKVINGKIPEEIGNTLTRRQEVCAIRNRHCCPARRPRSDQRVAVTGRSAMIVSFFALVSVCRNVGM
jgi:hypothetical protein